MTVYRHLILSPLKTNDGSKIQVRGRHVLYGIPMQRISTSSWIEVSYELLRYYENQRIHSRTQIGARTSLILSEPGTQTLLHVQPHKNDGNTSISNRYQTLRDRVESYTMRTRLSSLFSSETTLKLIIIFLSNHINIYLLLSYVKKASSIISQQSAQDTLNSKPYGLLPQCVSCRRQSSKSRNFKKNCFTLRLCRRLYIFLTATNFEREESRFCTSRSSFVQQANSSSIQPRRSSA